jgi:hypothetical protein
VPTRVQEHVGERVAYLTRRAERAQVVTIGQDWPRTPEDAIHSARQTRADGLHSAPEGLLVVCLDDQVRVIAL